MKNIVFGFHFGDPHDRKGKTSVCAFMYGKPSSSPSTGSSIFEKKFAHRDDGFVVRFKVPSRSFARVHGAGRTGFEPVTMEYDTHFVNPYEVRLRLRSE